VFELGLGEVALAFTAASSKADQSAIADVLAVHGRAGFAVAWLRRKGLDWAAELLEPAAFARCPDIVRGASIMTHMRTRFNNFWK
jgi:hypothetical protein